MWCRLRNEHKLARARGRKRPGGGGVDETEATSGSGTERDKQGGTGVHDGRAAVDMYMRC